MKKIILILMFSFFLLACEPTETEEIITVSDTPYLVFETLNSEGAEEYLVPTGKAMAVGDVESFEFQYNVTLYSTEVQRGMMNIEAINILLDGKEDYSHLVIITIMDEVGEKLMPVFNYAITVTVKVELLEPIDEAEAIEQGLDLSYVNVDDSVAACEAIFGKEVSFNLSFTLINI